MIKHTQAIRRLLPTNCLSVFDHFVGLGLKELSFHSFVKFYQHICLGRSSNKHIPLALSLWLESTSEKIINIFQ